MDALKLDKRVFIMNENKLVHIQDFNQTTRQEGVVDLRDDYRLVLEKKIVLVSPNEKYIVSKSVNISDHGLMLTLKTRYPYLLLPNDRIRLKSTWLIGTGIIKHVQLVNQNIVVGLDLNFSKHKQSLFIDIMV